MKQYLQNFPIKLFFFPHPKPIKQLFSVPTLRFFVSHISCMPANLNKHGHMHTHLKHTCGQDIKCGSQPLIQAAPVSWCCGTAKGLFVCFFPTHSLTFYVCVCEHVCVPLFKVSIFPSTPPHLSTCCSFLHYIPPLSPSHFIPAIITPSLDLSLSLSAPVTEKQTLSAVLLITAPRQPLHHWEKAEISNKSTPVPGMNAQSGVGDSQFRGK